MSGIEPDPHVPDPHVIVVDDDARLRRLLQRYLSEQGFRVSVADGAAAIRTAKPWAIACASATAS